MLSTDKKDESIGAATPQELQFFANSAADSLAWQLQAEYIDQITNAQGISGVFVQFFGLATHVEKKQLATQLRENLEAGHFKNLKDIGGYLDRGFLSNRKIARTHKISPGRLESTLIQLAQTLSKEMGVPLPRVCPHIAVHLKRVDDALNIMLGD